MKVLPRDVRRRYRRTVRRLHGLPAHQPDDKIRWLARHMLDGRVWDADTVASQDPHVVQLVFMPVAFGALRRYSRLQLGRLYVFAVYGEDQSGDRAINGMPMFLSMRVWLRGDALKAAKLAQRMHDALEDVR